MLQYESIVRTNALGNFQTLLTQVAESTAELEVLSNVFNIGSNPATPPNVNFAREVMQLFTIGPFKLNMDGSEQKDFSGIPIPNYSEADIVTLAYAMTGYDVTTSATSSDPNAAVESSFVSSWHYRGNPASYQGNPLNVFMGEPFAIPTGEDPIAYVASVLAHHPSAAPFQAKEMLERFVTEKPSPGYISRIAAVWQANVDQPNQIATVVKAIVDDSEFPSSYQSMPKQPAETVFDFLRQMPVLFSPLTATGTAANSYAGAESVINLLRATGQDPFYPPSVFSFYPPGDVEAADTNANYLGWLKYMDYVLTNTSTGSMGVWIDIPTLRQRIATANSTASTTVSPTAVTGQMVASYLLDAMIDGGSAARRTELMTLLGATPIDGNIREAVWLVAASPEFTVN